MSRRPALPTPPSRGKLSAQAYQQPLYTQPYHPLVGAPVPGRPPAVLDFQQGLQLAPYYGGPDIAAAAGDPSQQTGSHHPYGFAAYSPDATYGAPAYPPGAYPPAAYHGQPTAFAAAAPVYGTQGFGMSPFGAPAFSPATHEAGHFAAPYGPELHAELNHASMLSSIQHQVVQHSGEQTGEKVHPRRVKAINMDSEIRRCISRRRQEGAYN
eukprot:383357-Rhodomonas_salina.2